MRNALVVFLLALLAGCTHWWNDGQLTQEGAVAILGESVLAVTLAAVPQSSGCTDPRCIELDTLEAQLYADARAGRIAWLQLVDDFYQRRASLFPDIHDDNFVLELKQYQHGLAADMDAGRLTEAEWVEANDYKFEQLLRKYRSPAQY